MDLNYDDLHHMANNDKLLRQIMGIEFDNYYATTTDYLDTARLFLDKMKKEKPNLPLGDTQPGKAIFHF